MSHDHAHAGRANYYLDQICTVGACGALAVISVLMWWENRLANILAPQFFIPVLIGGIALLALVIVRGSVLWAEAGRETQHHEHNHDEDCGHDHGHCDHNHDHAWTPAKYAVLLLPVILYIMGLPNAGFSADFFRKDKSLTGELESIDQDVKSKGSMAIGFRELKEATYYEDKREALEGHTIKLKGMFMRLGSDKAFTLFRVRIYCCQADAVPLAVRIVSPASITRFNDKDWVEVEGTVQFRKLLGQNKFAPVLVLESADNVRPTEPVLSDADLQ